MQNTTPLSTKTLRRQFLPESGRPGRRHRMMKSQISVQICLDHEEKKLCRDFSYDLLMQPHYGLQSPEIGDLWLGPLEDQVYLAAFDNATGNLVGTFRLLPNYNLSSFPNIHKTLNAHIQQGRKIVDVGAYINPSNRQNMEIFEILFAETIGYLIKQGIDGVYIQVKPEQVPVYSKLGFIPASDPFRPEGWDWEWQAMFLRVDQISKSYDKPVFQSLWRQKTGFSLNASFWSRIMRRIASQNN